MRVHDDVLKCVAFLVAKCKTGVVVGGTGFFIGVETSSWDWYDDWRNGEFTGEFGESFHHYFVTAKHSLLEARETGRTYIRVNTQKSVKLVQARDWFISDDADVALVPFGPDEKTFDYVPISERIALNDETVREHRIGLGDELAIVGLFPERHGKKQNAPIVRVGTIAAMPGEPIADRYGASYPGYLTEARSLAGLSGSPVFAMLEPGRVIHERRRGIELNNPEYQKIQEHRIVYLLGMVRGHWDFKRFGLPIHFDKEQIHAMNTGVSIVTPIQGVTRLLYREDVVKQRKETDKNRFPKTLQQGRIAPDSAFERASDLGREEFERALKKVSRKIVPDREKKGT